MSELDFAPMIGGRPFTSVEERERLMQDALNAPVSLLGEGVPVQILRDKPPLVLNEKSSGWAASVTQAVRDGRVIQGKMRDNPEVARVIASASYHLHIQEAERARQTVVAIDAAATATAPLAKGAEERKP